MPHSDAVNRDALVHHVELWQAVDASPNRRSTLVLHLPAHYEGRSDLHWAQAASCLLSSGPSLMDRPKLGAGGALGCGRIGAAERCIGATIGHGRSCGRRSAARARRVMANNDPRAVALQGQPPGPLESPLGRAARSSLARS